jgi:hypothetical protein
MPLATDPVSRRTAAEIEAAEAAAWRDLVAAAPQEWARHVGLATREVEGALVTSWATSGRRYFSRAIGLGVTAPATEAALDDILAGWARQGIDRFLLQSQPHCEPAAYGDWLGARGLEEFDRQDRVVREGHVPLAGVSFGEGRALEVEWATRATAEEWARFVDRVYDLDTGPWLPPLVGRPGWHHVLVREEGELVAARSLYVTPDRDGWLCIDAPVPGLRTADYEPDAVACAALVRRGLDLGVRRFGADIEAPAAAQDTPAYASFAALGFTCPYTHVHHGRI